MQKVTVALGPDKGRVFNLSPGSPVNIGRRGAEVLLTDHNISRQHAQFLFKDGQWWVIDLGSTNGTIINGIRITQAAALKGGDQIQIGRSTLIFHGTPASQRKDRPDHPSSSRTPVAGPATTTSVPIAQVVQQVATPPPLDEDGPEQVALNVLSRQDAPSQKTGRAIDPNALDELEQYLKQGRANRTSDPLQSASAAQLENFPRPKPVPNATMPVQDEQIIPAPDMPLSPTAEAVVVPSTNNAPPPAPSTPPAPTVSLAPPVPPVSAQLPEPPLPLVAVDNTDAVQPPPQVEHAVSVWGDDKIIAPTVDDSSLPANIDAVAVGIDDDQPQDTATISRDELQPVDPSRILAVAWNEAPPARDVAAEPGGLELDASQNDHVNANEDEHSIFAELTDEAQPLADEHLSPSSHEAPTEPAIGAVEHDTIDAAGSIVADDNWPAVEEQFASLLLTDATIDPLYPHDIGGEFAYASSTAADTAWIDSTQEPDACPTLMTATLTMAVEAEPQIGVVPEDEDEDDWEDDEHRRAPQTVAVLPPEVEIPPAPEVDVEEIEIVEQVPAAPVVPVVKTSLPDQAKPLVPGTPGATAQFKRRPAMPGVLIEPDTEFNDQVEEEEYDYYAWEERQQQVLHRRIKIGVVIMLGLAALLFAGTQAVYIWMQFGGNHQPAPPPTAAKVTPAKPTKTDPGQVVDPLDNIPDSGENNMSNVLNAMKKQAGELDKELEK